MRRSRAAIKEPDLAHQLAGLDDRAPALHTVEQHLEPSVEEHEEPVGAPSLMNDPLSRPEAHLKSGRQHPFDVVLLEGAQKRTEFNHVPLPAPSGEAWAVAVAR